MFLFYSIISQLEFNVVFKSRCLQHEKYLSILGDNMVQMIDRASRLYGAPTQSSENKSIKRQFRDIFLFREN